MLGKILDGFFGSLEKFFDRLFNDGWIGILGILIFIGVLIFVVIRVLL